jgi:hypothetical protein
MRQYGTIITPDKKIVRHRIGKANVEHKGRQYHFTLCQHCEFSPLIHCKETDKVFSLGWQDILNMAGDAGIMEGSPEHG